MLIHKCKNVNVYTHIYTQARRWSGIFSFVLNGFANGISHAGSMYHQDVQSIIYPVVAQCFCGVFLGLFMLFGEGHLINTPAVPFALTCALACFLWDVLVVYRGDDYLTWMHVIEGWWAEPICMVNLWIVIVLSRLYILRGARKDIQQDIKQYRDVWQTVIDIEEIEQAEISRSMGECANTTHSHSHHVGTHVHKFTQLQLLSKMVRTISESISHQRRVATHSVVRTMRHPYTYRKRRDREGGGGGEEKYTEKNQGNQNEEICDPFRLPTSNSSPTRSMCYSSANGSAWSGLTSVLRACYPLSSFNQVCL